MLELAGSRDRDAVNRICRQAMELHTRWRPDLFRLEEEPYSEEAFQEEIRREQLFVGKINHQVVGYLRFAFLETAGPGVHSRKVLTIEEFAVEESCRNQGIGTQMMQEIRVLARAFRCTDLELAVYPQNDEAVGFCQKCGFTIQCIHMQRKV